ncbi:MAG: penicillin-binding protein 1C [Burkholderiaceae bacterium]|nr:penicillin-binding protein 1C [Burkholderiaceae bacterium]
MKVGRVICQTIAILIIAIQADNTPAMPQFEEVKSAFQPSDVHIVDRNGEWLHSLRADKTVRRGQWVALADISPALRTAMVLSEDKRFYEHSGVDWRAVSSAAWGNVWNTKTRGASTITMQLAGLLDEDLKTGVAGRSLPQKLGQTVAAQVLERRWRKDQILEAYLNNVPFRGEMVGIDALSRTLFGKAAHGLDDREAAVTAALVRAPNARAGAVAQRACGVLKVMQPTVKTDCVGLDLYVTAALQRKAFDASSGIAPHVARRVLSAGSPRTVTTTLRAPLQRFAVQTLDRHLRELQSRHVEDGAIVVLDNATGAVLAWVGSSGELGRSGEVDFVTALRQPGSTLKPFLYAQAIAERRLTAASLLEDSPTHIQTAGGLYIPQNYDHQFKGWVSVRTALGSSLNVPAVRTLVMVSPDAFAKQLKTLGLPLKEAGDFYGYSLALGSAEVSLLNLTNAYRSLANGGRTSSIKLTVRAEPVEAFMPANPSTSSGRTDIRASEASTQATTQAIDPRAAFIVSDILSDTNARARTFGSDSVLATRFWSAVKTGTSKDMRDNWAVGYSQRYTVGVWVGNASGAAMWDVSGTTGAAPVWAAVMQFLHRNEASKAPPAPAKLVQVQAQFASDGASKGGSSVVEATRQEWFLAGTEQSQFAINKIAPKTINTPDIAKNKGKNDLIEAKSTQNDGSSASSARITTPTSGTIIALDPDIPPNRQRVSFQAEGQNVAWLLDGKPFAKGNAAQWLPWPGRHVVQLVDAKGVKLDEIRLEVRGAGVKSAQSGPLGRDAAPIRQ